MIANNIDSRAAEGTFPIEAKKGRRQSAKVTWSGQRRQIHTLNQERSGYDGRTTMSLLLSTKHFLILKHYLTK